MIFNLGKVCNTLNRRVPSFGFYRTGEWTKWLSWYNYLYPWNVGDFGSNTERCCHLAVARLNRAIHHTKVL